MFIKYYISLFKGVNFETSPPNAKQLLIYGFLFMNRTMRDEVNISLEFLVTKCGYKISRSSGKSIETFRQELHNMIQIKNIGHFELSTETDILTILPNKTFTIYLGEIIADSDQFTKILFDEFDKITASDYSYKCNMLLIYLYIKSFIYEKPKEKQLYSVANPEEPQRGCSISLYDMSVATGISISSIQTIIKELQDLKLITSYTTGKYLSSKGTLCNAKNIYVLYGEESEIPNVEQRLKQFYNVKKFIN
jgi:hypothetical protein